MKRIVIVLSVALLLIGALGVASTVYAAGSPAQAATVAVAERRNGNRGGGTPGTDAALPPAETPLSASEIEALGMALDDEYKALATYQAVMATYGEVRPFVNIAKAEESHIAALVTLYERYGLVVPENPYTGNAPSFDSLADACAAGVEAEIANAALYDELFAMVDNADIIQVFESLRDASQEQHLPAFERCAN